jgi:hypothetical protein
MSFNLFYWSQRYTGRKSHAASAVATAIFGLVSVAHAQCVGTQYGTVKMGAYLLQNDEWGLNNGAGTQQVCVRSARKGSWSSEWNWARGNSRIKAYPSIIRGWQWGTWSPNRGGFPVRVSKQAPLPSRVDYHMVGKNQYDTAYDLFFSPQANPQKPSAELMVWLSYKDNRPAGNRVASGVALGGVGGKWDVWTGNVGWPVWTFVRTEQTNSFKSNLQPFVYYVAYTNKWLNTNWYELDVEFGAEIIQSNGAPGGVKVATFSASAY